MGVSACMCLCINARARWCCSSPSCYFTTILSYMLLSRSFIPINEITNWNSPDWRNPGQNKGFQRLGKKKTTEDRYTKVADLNGLGQVRARARGRNLCVRSPIISPQSKQQSVLPGVTQVLKVFEKSSGPIALGFLHTKRQTARRNLGAPRMAEVTAGDLVTRCVRYCPCLCS